jgi:nucleotide-binding universal stress UspA family protein
MKREKGKQGVRARPGQFTDLALEAPFAVGDAERPARGVILHPTDYSEPSRQAFELACRVARDRGSRLIVMHVAEPVRLSSLGMAPVAPLPKGYRGAWEARLCMVQAQDPEVRIEHRLEEGDAAAEILRVAHETACDLIVMGTQARTGLTGRLRGGVSGKVRCKAPCPVFVLTTPLPRPQPSSGSRWEGLGEARRPASGAPKEEDKLRTIVYPTDFSRTAECAFELARSLARDSGGELIVVHVAPVPALYVKKGYREEVEVALRRMTQSDPTVRMRWVLLAGEPVPEILWMAREGPCDLIVMGTHGRTGLKRLLRRSVAREVQREAPRPVSVVNLPPSDAGRLPEFLPEEATAHTGSLSADGGVATEESKLPARMVSAG